MKTILSIPIAKWFTIPATKENLGSATFVRIDEKKEQHYPNNALCIDGGNNGSYIENKEYFILHDVEVIPV